MQEHINQAQHNAELLAILDEKVSDNYFDWKITITFYTALHLVHALAKKRRLNIGHDHKTIISNIDPAPKEGTPIMPLDKEVHDSYLDLYQYSRRVRYDGFRCDIQMFIKLRQLEYKTCCEHLQQIKLSLKREGLPIT